MVSNDLTASSLKADTLFVAAGNAFSQRHLEAALAACDTAESFGYNRSECAGLRWQCRMMLGDFAGAWQESDRIAANGDSGSSALWDGTAFSGKRVVVRCLHGYGDAIQFLRYAQLVRRSAIQVIVETHPEMVSLLQRMRGIDRVVTWAAHQPLGRDALPRDSWDQQIEVTELPWAFRTELSTIPASVPYIEIASEARLRSLQLLGRGIRPKVGLVWASSAWNPARCILLSTLLPILDHDRFSFYSLQRGSERGQLAEITHARRIQDTAAHSADIVDTAADLLNMDLLITVDTMAAHLAGALGVDTWVLLPYEADWRWMVNRDDSPWYPTMRLFRQTSQGDWDSVVEAIAAALKSRHS
jgi:hypothetical protein